MRWCGSGPSSSCVPETRGDEPLKPIRPARAVCGLLALAALCGSFLFPRLFAAAAPYNQTYAIFIKSALAGTETVTEEWDSSGKLVATTQSEIFLDDGLERKRMAFDTRMVLTKAYAPVTYSYRYTSGSTGDGYEVAVKEARIIRTLTRNGRATEASVALQPGVVILDFSVYHQFDYVIRKYDMKKGGRQTFANFIPLIAADIPLAITRMEDSEIQHSKGSLPVRVFRVEFVGMWGAILEADREGRLVRLAVRDQDLEVVRKDLIPESAPESKPPVPPDR